MKRLIVAILVCSLFWTTGCRKRDRRIVKQLKPEVRKLVLDKDKQARPALELPEKKPLTLHDVSFIIVTENNIKELFENMDKDGEVKVLFALKGGEYKLLSLNVRTLMDYIAYQREVIIAYKDYYEGKDETD